MAWNTRQSGNIMLALFAAVGMVGMVGATGMAIMKGPVRAMAQVTKRTIAENNMIASAKLAVIAAGTQGDCDGDGLIETMAWSTSGTGPVIMGGGYLPATIGASLQDPWGNTYSYCSWDMGSQIKKATPVPACPTPAQRLSGVAVPTNQTVIAIISSGPNRIFETTCGNNPAYVTKVSGSDDVIQSYTYAEANAIGAGLWNLKSANLNVAEIKKDLEVKNAANNVVFGVDATSDINKPSIKVDYIKALSNPSIQLLSNLNLAAGLTRVDGASGYDGWGSTTLGTLPATDLDASRPGISTLYRINNHGGLSFSAHSAYGGIRFYNQGYSSTDPAGAYKASAGASMVMALVNNNVGIGTGSPAQRLHVVGNALVEGELNVTGGMRTRSTQVLWLGEETQASGPPNRDGAIISYEAENVFGAIAGNDGLVFEKTDTNALTPDGGIMFANRGMDGVRRPALNIRGDGTVNINGHLTGGNGSNFHIDAETSGRSVYLNWYNTGDVFARNTVLASSDQRLKKNIKPIHDALDSLSLIHGVYFDWRDEGRKGRQVGVIAQDVEKVYPELVAEDKDGFKTVSYSGLVAPLIEAVQEQQSEIMELKADNDSLRIRMEALEAK